MKSFICLFDSVLIVGDTHIIIGNQRAKTR